MVADNFAVLLRVSCQGTGRNSSNMGIAGAWWLKQQLSIPHALCQLASLCPWSLYLGITTNNSGICTGH